MDIGRNGATRVATAALVVGIVVSALTACSFTHEPRVLTVPGTNATIQGAVDAAGPGDLILVSPGTYNEAVRVEKDDLTIRGTDRNTVVLDGQDTLNSGFTVVSNGVSVENLTVHSYRKNGVIFSGTGSNGYHDPYEKPDDGELHYVDRYRVAYVTSYNNGLYGIYAFQAQNGVIEHSYVSGHPDSGLYVGQCDPCNVVITDTTAENNAIGYYGTNASGDVYVVKSTFRGNRLGVAPNSQNQELLAPQRETYVVGNLVVDNDNPETPPIERGFFGGGIAVGGGHGNLVARNLVTGHQVYGIGVVTMNPFDPEDNQIIGNVLSDNGLDLLYAPSAGVTATAGNCFADNEFATSIPEAIETPMPCDGQEHAVDAVDIRYPAAPPGVDYRSMPAPPAQPTMPGTAAELGALAAALPATPEFPDLDSIGLPTP
jgi:nitrous oxidase accessory protein NosD